MMKINKYIGMALCSWLMVACQNDDMEQIQQQDAERYSLIGQIVNNETESRAQIELGCQAAVEYFFWNEKDSFSLYQHKDNELIESQFVISENYSEANAAQQAEFTSTTALTPSVAYSAIYPSPATVTENKVRLDIQRYVDFSAATTDEERAEVWKNYFKNNMFMTASGTFSESGRNYIQFKHLCSLARITYINQTGSEQQINGVRLKGQNLGIFMNYDLLNNRESGSGSTIYYTFKTTGLTVADKDTVDVYILFFPKTIEQTDLEITIMQPEGDKTLSLPWKDLVIANGNNESFRAGMRYWFDVTDTANGLDWTKNTAEEGWVVFGNTEFSAALYDVLGNYKVLMTDDGYAKITQTHVNSVSELDFSNYEGKLSNLNGIETFRNLRTLKCNDFGLEMDTCDLSIFNSLSHVELAGNNLKALKLPSNTWSMTYLDCHDNRISNLDITGLKYIEYNNGTLICGSQKDNIKLKLTMTDNQKNKWESEWMNNEFNTRVIYDGMPEDVVIKNKELSKALYGVLGAEKVSFNEDSCAIMNQSVVDGITALNFSGKGYTITSLDGIEHFVNLDDLRCNNVGLVSCDLSKNLSLKLLMLTGGKFETLDLGSNVNLEVLYADGCSNMTTLKLDNCTKLGFVKLTNSKALKSLDIPNKPRVYNLDYSSTSLDVNLSEYTGLRTLKCSFMGLTNLNLSTETKAKITFMECSGNNLGDFDLSEYVSLETFSAFNAGITSLNLSGASNLKQLWCFQNKIQNLDISSLEKLEKLKCGQQQNDIVLQLKMTEAQKTMWESTWSADGNNTNVEVQANN